MGQPTPDRIALHARDIWLACACLLGASSLLSAGAVRLWDRAGPRYTYPRDGLGGSALQELLASGGRLVLDLWKAGVGSAASLANYKVAFQNVQ